MKRAAKSKASAGYSGRRRLLLGGIVLAATVSGLRTAQLSVLRHGFWIERASAQHTDPIVLPAPRGTIYDRDGIPLAASREAYQLAIAPREIVDRDELVALLREHVGFSAGEALQAVENDVSWRVLPGRYDEAVRDALDDIRGVHIVAVMRRFYPHGRLAGEILGQVNAEGTALGGIELQFDSLLTGAAGEAIVRHDPSGRPLPGAALRVHDPEPGLDIYLTIDYELQEIADAALRDALSATEAQGGDLLLLDPRTGEVLAAASRRQDGTANNWQAVTSPYEAGSVMKPFTVAALISESRMALTDSVFGEHGSYTAGGRTIHDDGHEFGWLTLADGLRFSSNIVLAKASQALEREEQYRYLRDFGFGTPTGVGYPAESGGRLYTPDRWTRPSSASLAMGYEVSVTPLQLAMAYAALANGGILMEPSLVREIRSRSGRVVRQHEPNGVRRVVSREVSESIRDVMVGVVETGTGQAAALGPFAVAGKTGTAKIVIGGHYEPGAYNATFAGFFPAVDPQLVFVVKLDRPRGTYYGGTTAAPVTRATLEAALAARGTPLDRRAMASRPAPMPGLWRTGLEPVRGVEVGGMSTSFAASPAAAKPPTVSVSVGQVPRVRGLSVRDAAAAVAAAGYAVQVMGSGQVLRTEPVAGARLSAGGLVRLIARVR